MSQPVFGLSTAHIDSEDIAASIQRCVELGLDAIEFFTCEYSVAECRDIADHARDAGLHVDYHAPWHGPYDFGLAERDIARSHLEQAMARAHLMGCRHLVCHLGRYDLDAPQGREQALDQVISITDSLEPALRDTGLMLVYEDNTLCHDPNPLGDSPGDFARLFDAVESDHVGMILDTGHAHVTGNTRAYLDQFGSRVRYIHVADNGGIGDDHVPPSAGTIDWPQLVEWLAYYGARPNFAIEFNERFVPAELPTLRSLAAAQNWRG